LFILSFPLSNEQIILQNLGLEVLELVIFWTPENNDDNAFTLTAEVIGAMAIQSRGGLG